MRQHFERKCTRRSVNIFMASLDLDSFKTHARSQMHSRTDAHVKHHRPRDRQRERQRDRPRVRYDTPNTHTWTHTLVHTCKSSALAKHIATHTATHIAIHHCFWQTSDSVCTTVLTVTLSKKTADFFVGLSTTRVCQGE